jgi:hypothetical protein
LLSEAYDCKPTICGKGTGQFVNIFMSYVMLQNKKEDLCDPNCISRFCGVSCQNSTGLVGLNNNYDQYLSNDYVVQTDIDRPETTASTSMQVTTTFNDQEEEPMVDMSAIPRSYRPTSGLNVSLDEYLRRPVKIRTQNWVLGTSIDTSFAPWQLFFSNAAIKRKIDNYAFIRCDLHLKVLINASPFYYGAMLVSYDPLEDLFNSAKITLNSLVPLSQRPNIIIYPQKSSGGEMVFPFIYPREWLDITSSADTSQMGRVHLDTFDILRSANGNVGTSVDVQFFAWADNVELSGLTVDLAVQGSRDGPISKPASAIARATGLLNKIPVVGNFMTSASMAAQSVSDIAGLFGYTKTPIIDDVQVFKNLPFHGLATSEISDVTERLCIDSKNQLTIDTVSIGDSSNDALHLSKFVNHKSFLTSYSWQSSDAASTLLWNSYVTPFMSQVSVGTGQSVVNGTPMWLVSNLFDYWRGDIIFEFQIICTQYHRGRLRVSWDPVGDIANTVDSNPQVYNYIIDIADTDTISLRIPYTQRTAYQKIPSNLSSTIYSTTVLAKDTSDTVNGILTVRVLNELSSPVDTSDVTVLVFVRGAENLEFAAPKKISEDLYYYTVQTDVDFAGSSSVDPNINLVYMGEKVENLRSLMMRCNFHRALTVSIHPTREDYHVSSMNRRPLFKGFDPDGINSANNIVSTPTSSPYNFVANTPYHMISQCFLGERGSFTWKMDFDAVEPASIMVSRPKETLQTTKYAWTRTDLNATTTNQTVAVFANNEETNSGALLINQRTNTGISVNLPQYSITSFLDTSPVDRTTGLINITTDDSMRVSMVQKESQIATTESGFFKYYFQVGPDYTPVFFLNVPTMYIYNSVPLGE